MFVDFFFLLRAYGVPVTLTEWLALMEALARGLAFCNLNEFYSLARSILVKSEALFDQYDQAFQHAFKGIETRQEIADEVWQWLSDPLVGLDMTPEQKAALMAEFPDLDLDELRRMFEERLREQTEAHHGGNYWVGTGGTSAFGHSGFHPGGIRVGGESHGRSAVKVAAERRYRGYRTDTQVGVRQFEVALRRLRQLSSKNDSLPDELDLDGTIQETADHAGMLTLKWTRSRRNNVKVLLLMDVGGSMHPYVQTCSQLFAAVNRSSHFKDLRYYYFHNCIYDHLYLDHSCSTRNSVLTARILKELPGDYKVIIVGDAAMAPSELLSKNGIIWWGYENTEPGMEWLRRVARHFPHSVWLNPEDEGYWDSTYGATTLRHVRTVFPMYPLTVDGLTAAVKRLMVRGIPSLPAVR